MTTPFPGSDLDGQAFPGLQGGTPDQAVNPILPNQLTGIPSLNNQPPASPRNLAMLQGPEQGPATTPIITPASLALPQGLTATGANLIPVIAMAVLGRGMRDPSYVIPLNIAGLTNIIVRATYEDLHINPGVRGIQLQCPAIASPVFITNNYTGMKYGFKAGSMTIFIPLYFNRMMFDLTISSASAFPAGSTALLTTEEQVPFVELF